MTSTQSAPPAFSIHPANLPADIPELQSVTTRAFGDHSLFAAEETQSQELQSFQRQLRGIRQRYILQGRRFPSALNILGVAKTSDGKIAGYITLRSTCERSLVSPFSDISVFKDVVIPEGGQDLIDRGRAHDEAFETMAAELMGEDRYSHWWQIVMLAVDTEYQGRGLGTKLVRWGIGQARDDAATRGAGDVKGIWVIASDSGMRSYSKEGMRPLREVRVGGRLFTALTMDFV